MKRLLGLAVVMLLASWPAAASAKHCSNSSLKGTYTYAFEANVPGGGPVAAVVGTITFDGHGSLSLTLTESFGYTHDTNVFTGTYTVSPDCTYTSEFGNPPNLSHQFGIIAQHGDKIRVLNTDDQGLILAFTAEKEEE